MILVTLCMPEEYINGLECLHSHEAQEKWTIYKYSISEMKSVKQFLITSICTYVNVAMLMFYDWLL